MLTCDYRGWTSGTITLKKNYSVYYSLGSCEVSVNNYFNGNITYCWKDIRDVANYIAWNCQATQKAHGGFCATNNSLDIGV